MRPDESDAAHVWDMLQAALEARRYLARVSEPRFLRNRLRQRALERTLEILGEAAGRVRGEFRARHPEIDWRGIVGQRNVLAHKYGEIDHALLYRTVTRRVPPLIRSLRCLAGKKRA